MKNGDCDSLNGTSCHTNESEEVTDFLIDYTKRGHALIKCNGDVARSFNVLKPLTSMGHKGPYQRVLLKKPVSQSLPNCCEGEDCESLNGCDSDERPLEEAVSPPHSPSSEQWFRTWPERCDKIKSNKSSPETGSVRNTQTPHKSRNDCDIVVKTTLTLSEALQNISLAYSPITKQLHLVDNTNGAPALENNCNHDKKGHKRTEAGSFSSTISSLSDPSPSGSLLDADERSLNGYEDYNTGPQRKKTLSSFFTRSFSWRGNLVQNGASGGVWKLFSRPARESASSPHHVASSSALIQHARPSNLPAKTEEEELRHREEYKAMVVAAKKKEAQNTAAKLKQQKLQLEQEEHQSTATKHFSKHVIGHWEVMHTNRKTRDLWWKGLPSSVRGKVWRLAIGNDLNLTPQLYEICVSRAQTRLNSPVPSHYESDIDQEGSMDVIQLDISRTFPHLGIFQEGGPYSDMLHSLLAAYVCYRPDVGYVQGMSYIAAILILNMDGFEAFICFANLLNQPLHLAAFGLKQEQMEAYYNAYNEVFCYNLPKLFGHFESSSLTPDLYLLDWVYTVFAKAMPLDVACRVWDVFLRDGYEFIFRTALGILHLNQDSLIEMDFLHGAQFLTHLPDDLSSDQLFKSIQGVTTTIGKQSFQQIVDKHNR